LAISYLHVAIGIEIGKWLLHIAVRHFPYSIFHSPIYRLNSACSLCVIPIGANDCVHTQLNR